MTRSFHETALMRLGTQVSRFAQDGPDITIRLYSADLDRLQAAWAEVVSRILRLERCGSQSHRVRASLRWLRRWEIWIGEELHRREVIAAEPHCTCDVPTRPCCGCGQCGECAGAPPPPECAACGGRVEWS